MIQFIIGCILGMITGLFICITTLSVGKDNQIQEAYRHGYADGFHDAIN